MANEIMKVKSYASLYSESTWGTKPGSPAYLDVPVLSCGIKFNRSMIEVPAFTGLLTGKHAEPKSGMPQGGLSLPLFGWIDGNVSMSPMQYILDWIFGDPEATETASKGLQWAEGPDVANKEWNGLRINSATIQGSADSGFVEAALDLQGQSESALVTARAIPASRNKMYLPLFRNCTFSIGGVAIPMAQFSIQVQRGLKATYLNNFTPLHLRAHQNVIVVQVTPVKNAATYDVLRRASSATEVALQLTMKALHNGTGTGGTNYTVGTLDWARAVFMDADEEGGREDLAMQPLHYNVKKSDDSTAPTVVTMSQAA